MRQVTFEKDGDRFSLVVTGEYQIPFYPDPEPCWPFDAVEVAPIYVSHVMYFAYNTQGVYCMQDNIPLDNDLRPINNVKAI